MQFKNLNYCKEQLQQGGYIATYSNYQGSGIRGRLAGTGLNNSDGKCLLTNCQKEFIHLRDAGLIRCDEDWGNKIYGGQEWYWAGKDE